MDVDRLFEHPIAHRGLHDLEAGIIENSRTAVLRAIEHGYAIEIDVQVTAEGDAVVFHDDDLDRLTEQNGPVRKRPLQGLIGIPLSGSTAGDTIWPIEELLKHVGGAVPLVIEMKSHWDGDLRLARRMANLLAAYEGPVCAESFDPTLVREFGGLAPGVPRGIIGYSYPAGEEGNLSAFRRFILRHLLHWPVTRPHFISWSVQDLEMASVRIARRMRVPVSAWTVRTPGDQARAGLFADQMVFEGFLP